MSKVNIYTPKSFIYSQEGFQGSFLPPLFRTIYEIRDAPHRHKIQKENNNNITKGIYMWRKRYNNQKKNSHVK